jgi:hypothetical protein
MTSESGGPDQGGGGWGRPGPPAFQREEGRHLRCIAVGPAGFELSQSRRGRVVGLIWRSAPFNFSEKLNPGPAGEDAESESANFAMSDHLSTPRQARWIGLTSGPPALSQSLNSSIESSSAQMCVDRERVLPNVPVRDRSRLPWRWPTTAPLPGPHHRYTGRPSQYSDQATCKQPNGRPNRSAVALLFNTDYSSLVFDDNRGCVSALTRHFDLFSVRSAPDRNQRDVSR